MVEIYFIALRSNKEHPSSFSNFLIDTETEESEYYYIILK